MRGTGGAPRAGRSCPQARGRNRYRFVSRWYSPRGVSGYTTQDVARMIGVSAGRLRAYLRAGVLSPEKGTRGELRFSFQDLLLLRKAEGLVSQRIPPHRVRRALKKLRERLTDAQPLTGLSLGTDGPQGVGDERGARWQVESGQVLLAFDKQDAAPDEVPMVAFPTRPAGGE